MFVVSYNLTFSQWTTLTSGSTEWLRGVWFTDNVTGYVVGYNGTILKTTDGNSWTPLTSNTTNNLMSVFFVTSNLGFACGVGGTILQTTNAGVTWTAQVSGTFNDLYEIFFVDQSTGYVAGQNGTCLKTTDGGTSWNLLASVVTGNGQVSLFFNNVNTGYLVGAGFTDAIMKTTDGGATFTNIHDNTAEEFASVYFTDLNNGYIVSDITHCILKTTNAGTTWTSQLSPVNGGLYSVKFPSTNTGYIVGGYSTNSVILKTTNAGTSWTQQSSSTTNSLFDCYFLNDNLGYAVGKNGTIIKTANGGTGIEDLTNQINVSIYPNPASTLLTIDNSSQEKNLELQLINIEGQTVLNETTNSSRNVTNISELANGIYFLQVRNDKTTFNAKLIVQH